MLILDVDTADSGLRALLANHHPLEGLWGFKIGDEILKHGITNALYPWGKRYNFFVDLKHHDVAGRLERIVALYATLGPYAPKFLTISGERPVEAIAAAVKARGTIDIIVTGALSDEELTITEGVGKMLAAMNKVMRAGAQGVTFPAWIAAHIDSVLKRSAWQGCHSVFTGVVSEGVPARHHFNPRPLEFALAHGATHVVVGTEVVASNDPIRTLQTLTARCNAAALQPA